MRTMGTVSEPRELAGQIPRDPPVHRRPVHAHPSGYLRYLSAVKDRPNCVQALLNNRQDNQCQSRPPQSDIPAETSHQSGRKRASVADQLAEECRTSVAGGHCDYHVRAVTTFSTASRAHLRRASPDGLAVNSKDGREQSRGKKRPGRPAVGGGGSPGVSPLRGGSFRRVLRTRALRRGGCRARHPGDGRLRSPPYPAAAPASTTARSLPTRQRNGSREDVAGRSGSPRIVWAGPSSLMVL